VFPQKMANAVLFWF